LLDAPDDDDGPATQLDELEPGEDCSRVLDDDDDDGPAQPPPHGDDAAQGFACVVES
jgi:hypothetical protein